MHIVPIPFVHLNTAFLKFNHISISEMGKKRKLCDNLEQFLTRSVSETMQDQCKKQVEMKTTKLIFSIPSQSQK